MPRGTGDTFHRLLWITLVAVAFTFTVILTSVFVDIDDLLAKRNPPVLKQQAVTEAPKTDAGSRFLGDFQGYPSNEEDTDENDSTFRTKRSLESNSYVLHIKNPKMKKILTNRLATLLEELDEQESSKPTNAEVVDVINKKVDNPNYRSTEEMQHNKENTPNIKVMNHGKLKNEIGQKDLLHLAMHKILLQGVVEHMDLNEVYKKIHLLMKSFETNDDSDTKGINVPNFNKSTPMELIDVLKHNSYKEEDKFLDELINCEELHSEIVKKEKLKSANEKEIDKGPHLLIKTIIEITNNNRGKENIIYPNDNATGTMKLLYNGKEIKSIELIGNKNFENEAFHNKHLEENEQNAKPFHKNSNPEKQNIKESELDQAITEYLKTNSIKLHNKYIAKGTFVTKRLKRQIKIHYLDQVTTKKPRQIKEKPERDDDELYVEIETHFDGKGTKGEKKKKLVRTLIDKIQKAINSNPEMLNKHKTGLQNLRQIKKRMQNPIDYNELNTNTLSPIDVIEHRQLNPISKTANVIQPLTSVLDKSGSTWKKLYNGPGFLAASKSLNSAEMRELDVDYNSVMKNGIPKRLQKPINTENEDLFKPNEYAADKGNVTFVLKDINGSGFSIGINQYADEPPDKDTLKMFTGLENLLQAYHEHYDQTGAISDESEQVDQVDQTSSINHEIKRRDLNNHIKLKLSDDFEREKDNNKDQEINFAVTRSRSNRNKRNAINVKLFSNIKSKTKLNKFINTNAMLKKKIFFKSKRNKRQIDKIRIVASDHYPSNSREDVFFVSQENIYANRAIVKGDETPEVEVGDRNEDHYDYIAPYTYAMDIPNLRPAYLSRSYDTKHMHTYGLMSKYPHVFLENLASSQEFINVSPNGIVENNNYQKLNAERTMQLANDDKSIEKNMSSTNVDDIVNAILPTRNNFKVVLKIFPKNKTKISPGYKEVHTLINKSYDKNGVRYVSSVNVSEISKLENLNKTEDKVTSSTVSNKELDIRQKQIKLLLELHKDRIDQQLEHLKMESQKLKHMIGHENLNKNMSYLTEIFRQLGLKSPYEKNYFHLKNNISDIHAKAISSTLVSEAAITPKSSTNVIKEDHDKMEIINSINENGNITKQILHKIDKNTNILELFLRKLLDQTQSTPPGTTEKISTISTPKYLDADHMIPPLLEHLRTNFTNTIPFIYAFQHPLRENKEKHTNTLANVVYHGHIHANKVGNYGRNNDDFFKSIKNNLKTETKNMNNNRETSDNETKFFIDELENDFKIVSNDRIPILTPVKTNNTQI